MIRENSEVYEPTTIDLAWAIQVTSLIKNGGVLGMPAPGLTYVVDTVDKTLTRISGENEKCETRGVVVFKAIGWTCNNGRSTSFEYTE